MFGTVTDSAAQLANINFLDSFIKSFVFFILFKIQFHELRYHI